MGKPSHLIVSRQMLAGSNCVDFAKLLLQHRFKISGKYIPRLLYSFTLSSLGSVGGLIEKAFYQKKINSTKIEVDPIFIIGHWRSATTLLHNLMANDSTFGFLSTSQACLPNLMFSFQPLVKQFIKINMPEYRPMDKVRLIPTAPQEDELALANMSTTSCYHAWSFPEEFRSIFNKWCLWDNLSVSEIKRFERNYLLLLKKLTFANNGKQLILKNPANTGRIPFLLKLFPNAKFIYLSRTQEEVLSSSFRLHLKTLEVTTFQNYDEDQVCKEVTRLYQKLLAKYHKDRELIPNENLVEIEYQEMLKMPMEILQSIYGKLGFAHFDEVKSAFTRYLETQKNYQPAKYLIS